MKGRLRKIQNANTVDNKSSIIPGHSTKYFLSCNLMKATWAKKGLLKIDYRMFRTYVNLFSMYVNKNGIWLFMKFVFHLDGLHALQRAITTAQVIYFGLVLK